MTYAEVENGFNAKQMQLYSVINMHVISETQANIRFPKTLQEQIQDVCFGENIKKNLQVFCFPFASA